MQTEIQLLIQRAARAGISCYAICHRAGVHEGTVRRWKRAEHDPHPEVLGRFKAALEEIEAERK